MSDKIGTAGENSDVRRGESRRPGPQTPGGKERSKLNAVKTGIFAKVVLAAKGFNESRNDFEKLLADLQESVRPRDNFEQILVENLALQYFRLARLYQADAEVAPLLFKNVREKFEDNGSDLALLNGESANAGKLPAAELLMRYETGIWRQIDRILERLDHWRRLNAEPAGAEP